MEDHGTRDGRCSEHAEQTEEQEDRNVDDAIVLHADCRIDGEEVAWVARGICGYDFA